MTGIAQTSPDQYVSGRTPHLSLAVLIGAALIIGVVLQLLNSEPAATAHPLSGAPVEGVVPAGPAPDLVADPQATIGTASGALTVVIPADEEADPVQLGPAAFPPQAAVRLSIALPTTDHGFVTISHVKLATDGELASAEPLHLMVVPGEDGRATVQTSVEALTEQLGSGIYRVQVLWQNEVIGQEDVALGLHQPAGVAVFDEPRQVVFTAGEYVGVEFDHRGRVAAGKPFTLGANSGAPAAAYARFNGEGHVLITEGVWAGYWVPLGGGATLR